MVLMSRHKSMVYAVPVFAAIAVTGLVTWAMLRGASWLEQHLSRTFMNVTSRVMGLILAAVSVEFVVAGLREVVPTITQAQATTGG
jgi:small neutral amino acid transporter SnatA (MarC family)